MWLVKVSYTISEVLLSYIAHLAQCVYMETSESQVSAVMEISAG